MQLYNALPATNRTWTTTSIESLERLRGVKQTRWNQVVVSRVELVRLIVFTAIELSAHVVATAAKFAAAVIQVPLCPIFGGVKPRVALIDARSHLSRAGKLGTIILCSPAFLARPEWAVGLYQRFALVKEPKWRITSLQFIYSQIAACMIYKQYLRRFHIAPSQWWVRHPVLAGVAGVGGALATVAVAFVFLKACCRKKLPRSTVTLECSPMFKRQSPNRPLQVVHKYPDGGIVVIWGSSQLKYWQIFRNDSFLGELHADIVSVQNNGEIRFARGSELWVWNLDKEPRLLRNFNYCITYMKEMWDNSFAIGLENGHTRIEKMDESVETFNSDVLQPVVAITLWQEGIAVVYKDGHLVCKPKQGDLLTFKVPHGVSHLEASEHGTYFAMNDAVGGTFILNSSRRSSCLLEGSSPVTAIRWLSDTQLLTGDRKGVLRAWDAVDGTLLGERHDHSGPIHAITRQGKNDIYTSGHDGTTRCWAGLADIGKPQQ